MASSPARPGTSASNPASYNQHHQNIHPLQESVEVSATSSALLHNCRPLPEDIAQLDDQETACQFCGVSYLLLSKYDRVVVHVSKLEKELKELQNYKVEFPALNAKLASVEADLAQARTDSQEHQSEVKIIRDDLGKSVRALHELQLRHTKLTHDYEEASKRNDWLDSSRVSQIRSLVRSLVDVKDDLKDLRVSINTHKTVVANLLKKQFTATISDLSNRLHVSLPSLIQAKTDATVRAIQAKLSAERDNVKSELEDLKLELKDSEERYRIVEAEVASTREHYEECVQSLNDQLDGLQSQTGSLEREKISLQRQLNASIQQTQEKQTELNRKLKGVEEEKMVLESQLISIKRDLESVQKNLKEKEDDLIRMETKFAEERKSLENGAAANVNRALAQKDVQIHDLNKKIREYQKTIDELKDERQKMTEAHQSRVGQLQDKYQEMLKNAGNEHNANFEQGLRSKFEKEKVDLLAAQKAQIFDVQGKLQAQLDAARLARDQAAIESRRKLNNLEDEFKVKEEKLKGELDDCKSRNKSLQELLEETQKNLSLSNQTPALTAAPIDRDSETLRRELQRRDAEIAFLKETVKRECEERIELMTAVDALRRGLPTGGAGNDATKGGGGLKNGSRNGSGRTSVVGVRGGEVATAGGGLGALRDPQISSYQNMMNAATLKKAQKLKSGVRK
ncbi:hypothetical protein HDU76_006426 [Blyttiomyces sp. JEL0837]|nr:hypothetical protein HDU76_006426 [Blyttiomyces sp. JEL0837]